MSKKTINSDFIKKRSQNIKTFTVWFLLIVVIAGAIYIWRTFNVKSVADPEEIAKYSETEFFVKFRNEAFVGSQFSNSTAGFNTKNTKSINKVFEDEKVKNKEKFQKNGLDRVYKLRTKSGEKVTDAIKAYKDLDQVEYAEPLYIYKSAVTPNDPLYSTQYHLNKISSPDAWDIKKGDLDISVAVVDTGVDWDHADLDSNIWTNIADSWADPSDPTSGNSKDTDKNGFIDDYKGWDFVDINSSSLLSRCQSRGEDCLTRDNDPMDDYGHGTHVAGISSAVTNNSTGVAGAAWNVSIMPIRAGAAGYLETDDIVAGVQYAVDNGADIINASWGSSYESSLIRNVINYSRDNGVLWVAAAGNSNSQSAHYPSMFNDVIAVASTTSSDYRSSFSTYGSWVDVAAPGSSIYSTTTRRSVVGNSTYGYMSGTSMASPVVAGVAALLKSQNPSLELDELRNKVITNVDNIYSKNKNYQNMLGHGRINSEKVLTGSPSHVNGSVVTSVSTSKVYYIEGSTKRWISSPSIFTTQFKWSDIQWISAAKLSSYTTANEYLYPDGTLMSNSGKAYVVEYQAKRWITSPSVFLGLGYKWKSIIPLSNKIASKFSTGRNISTPYGFYRSGTIITASGDPKVYIVDNGTKRWIVNPGVFSVNYRTGRRIVWVSQSRKNSHPTGDNILRRDGAIIASYTTNKVYAIEYGKKRWITSPEAFKNAGYNWKIVRIINDNELGMYLDGDDIN